MKSKKIEFCKILIIHKENVENAKRNMPAEDLIYKIGDFFKVLGDPTRIKIINALFHSEMCVCDLAAALTMNQSAISHQLKILKQANLVKYRKNGKIAYYFLNDDHVRQIYEHGLIHIKEMNGILS